MDDDRVVEGKDQNKDEIKDQDQDYEKLRIRIMKSLGSKLWEVEDEDDENAAHAEFGAVRAREGGWGEQRPAPGEKILVKNGEKILVKNGEKILVKQI